MRTQIPPSSYSDPAVFAAEEERIFGRLWCCAGFQRQVANHNDFIARQVGRGSVLVHNFNGHLRAFQNVCSHRFNRIHPDGAGNRPLQCAYHGWTYDENGLPSAIPKRPRFDGLTQEKLCEMRLRPWDVETCGDLVFVRRGTTGPSLREFLGASHHTVETMTNACGPQIDLNVTTIRANWKILIENTLESYHVGFVHPETFGRLNTGEGGGSWQPPHSSWDAPLAPNVSSRMSRIAGFFESRPLKLPGYFHQLVFPCLTLASTQGMTISVQFFEPISPGETVFKSFVFQSRLDEISPGARAAVDAMNASVRDFNRAVFSEDRAVCEQVHLGTAESGQAGILSDEELRVGEFQRHYRLMMQESE